MLIYVCIEVNWLFYWIMYNDSVFYFIFILNMVLIVIENLYVLFLECWEVNEMCKGVCDLN